MWWKKCLKLVISFKISSSYFFPPCKQVVAIPLSNMFPKAFQKHKKYNGECNNIFHKSLKMFPQYCDEILMYVIQIEILASILAHKNIYDFMFLFLFCFSCCDSEDYLVMSFRMASFHKAMKQQKKGGENSCLN